MKKYRITMVDGGWDEIRGHTVIDAVTKLYEKSIFEGREIKLIELLKDYTK